MKMPKSCSRARKLSLVILTMCFVFSAHAGKATVDLSGLDDETRALVAKERARVMMIKSDGDKRKNQSDKAVSSGGAADSSSESSTAKNDSAAGLDSRRATVVKGGVTGGCDMNIGNTESRPGSGATRPKPVIITGPVVQLCNK